MSDVPISQIRVSPDGRLRVRPTKPPRFADYASIYRDVSFVRWDAIDYELYCLPIDGFSVADEFAQIRCAVLNEYGDKLMLFADTVFFGLPDEIVEMVKVRAASQWTAA